MAGGAAATLALGFVATSLRGTSVPAGHTIQIRETLTRTEGSSLRVAVRAFVYALLFVAAMEIAVDLARFGQSVTPLWIASAILAWALFHAPLRDWPIITGFAMVAHVARGVFAGDTLAMESIYLAANVGGPLVCAGLLYWADKRWGFEDRNAVLRFFLIGGLVGPAVSTLVAYAGSFIEPSRFKVSDLPIWFMADALSYVVFLPIFRIVFTGSWRELTAPTRRTRAAALLTLLLIVNTIGWFLPPTLYSFYTIFLPAFLIFIAFELGSPGARAAVAISALAIIGHAMLGPSSAVGLRGVELMLASQAYVASLVICVLPLADALTEKQRLYEEVSASLNDAQAAWGELIAAEAHYRLIADNADSMVMRIGLDGGIIFASPACSQLSDDVQALEGKKFWDLTPPDDAGPVRADLEIFIGAGVADRPHAIRVRLRDAAGTWRLFDARVTLIASHGDEAAELIAVLREVQS
ncbi:membrane hypothetical protein [uncultured Defluviicoccus sp.]|uniref:PAS domain-containing protein n=1 Tax=metagenome TaxID=256318 RepID=A0A380T8E1_9ZZZZ|nr:membrane hypothetical protein [uncultured Defluviicoccus sp.]